MKASSTPESSKRGSTSTPPPTGANVVTVMPTSPAGPASRMDATQSPTSTSTAARRGGPLSPQTTEGSTSISSSGPGRSTATPTTTTPQPPSSSSVTPAASPVAAADDASALPPLGSPAAVLSSGSVALAEFASLLRPADNSKHLREHIISMVNNVDGEDTLVRLARALEATGAAGRIDGGGSDDANTSRFSPNTAVSDSTTRMDGAGSSLRGGSGSVLVGRSRHRHGSASSSTGVDIQESILRTHLERQAVRQQNPPRHPAVAGRQRYSAVSVTTVTDHSDAGSSYVDEYSVSGVTTATRRRTLLGAAALGLSLFMDNNATASSAPEDSDLPHSGRSTTLGHEHHHHHHQQHDGGADMGSQVSSTSGIMTRMIDPLETSGAIPQIPEAVQRGGRRAAVSAAPFAPNAARQHSPKIVHKSPQEQRQLREMVRSCHLFSGLEEKDLDEVVQAMEKEVYAAGSSVLEQGQDSRNTLFLVTDGTCEAIKNGKGIGSVTAGGVFGELELMYKQAKCAATIRCVTRCVLYTLDEESYRHAVVTGTLQKRKKYEQLILSVPFLKELPDYERMKIAEALVTKHYRRGQYVIRFGTKGTHIHFIVEGEVKVIGRNQGKKVEVVRLRAGDVVGELEFLFNHLTVADVVVASRRLTTACISRSHCELILGPIQDRLKEFIATSPSYEAYYLKDVANASVRSEISRAESISLRKQRRRIASSAGEGALDVGEAAVMRNVDFNGEIVLPVRRSLLHNFTAADLLDEQEQKKDGGDSPGGGGGGDKAKRSSVATSTADELPLLFRFPFLPVGAKNDTIVLGLREDGVVLTWNDMLAKLTSYPAEEVVGQNVYSFLLESREQQVMYNAISTARAYAGDIEGFLADPHAGKAHRYTLARSDGLTRTVIRLSILPPLVSSGEDGADMLLAYGEEIKQTPHQIVDQSQWLSTQLRAILGDANYSYEARLQMVADAINSFEATYRALTMSTERLRVVNIRQMLGQVMMDFGADCVSRGLSVRQRFEGLSTERAYLDAELLPECLRFATSSCLAIPEATLLVITVTIMEKNGLEFLVINYNIDGHGYPADYVTVLETPLGELSSQNSGTESAGAPSDVDLASEKRSGRSRMTRAERQQLRRVRETVEQQGGTIRVQRNAKDANLFFLIPFMPAGAEEAENASVAESIVSMNTSCTTRSGALYSSTTGTGADRTPRGLAPGAALLGQAPPSAATQQPLADGSTGLALPSALSPTSLGAPRLGTGATTSQVPAATHHPKYNFTTLVAEDTPAHRNMLCSYLWERRHAVLPAYSVADIERLTGVADILFIDLRQSIIASMSSQDSIAILREKTRHMAVVITSTSFDDVSVETYHAAGFLTLRKPCTPVQAMQVIHRAEEKIFTVKQEAERIAQARETLAKNSRGAWRRGRLLGKGTFGEVYEAVDVLTGGTMAVKEMQLGKDDRRIEMFVEEVATMCSLQHPNIIHYFYCEQSSDMNAVRVFMEFAAGGTLQGLLSKRGKLPFKEFQSLLRDITEGLAYIHSQHYVHCDIKTANVLLNQDGVGKIGDFGTARTVRDGELLYDMQGSPLYMSPECMSAGDLDEDGEKTGYSFPTDVWSLGCVVLEMATNKPPFSHIGKFNGPAGFTNFLTSLTDTPDLSPLFDGPPSVIEFVSACLNPDPSRRATAQQLLQMSIFSEATDEDTKSAVMALERAQLLHVLNKFVAFQDPEEVTAQEEEALRFRTRKRSVCDFFHSSCSSSETDSEEDDSDDNGSSTDEDEAMMVKVRLPGAPTPAPAPASASASPSAPAEGGPARRKAIVGSSRSSSQSPSPDPVAAAAALDDVSPTPKKRSKTLSKPPAAHDAARLFAYTDDGSEAEAVFFATSSSSSSASAAPSSAAAPAQASSSPSTSTSAAVGSDPLQPGSDEFRNSAAGRATLAPSPTVTASMSSTSTSTSTSDTIPADADAPPAPPPLVEVIEEVPEEEEDQAQEAVVVARPKAMGVSPMLPPRTPFTMERAKQSLAFSPHTTTRGAAAAAGPGSTSGNDVGLQLPQAGASTVSNASFFPLLVAGLGGRGFLAPPAHSVKSKAESSVGNSFMAQPPSTPDLNAATHLSNNSFFNRSLVKNISFMGTNMEDVLNRVANDLLHNLASPSSAQLTRDSSEGTEGEKGDSGRPSRHHDPNDTADMRGTGDDPLSPTGSAGVVAMDTLAVPTSSSAAASRSGRPPRSPSPMPLRPSPRSDRTTASSSHFLDPVSVQYTGTDSTPTAASTHPSVDDQEGSQPSPMSSSNSSMETSYTSTVVTTATESEGQDVRRKIARKLRRARNVIANRSFFRIEDLAGPLGTSFSRGSGLLGRVRRHSGDSSQASAAGEALGAGNDRSASTLHVPTPSFAAVAPPSRSQSSLLPGAAGGNAAVHSSSADHGLGGSEASPNATPTRTVAAKSGATTMNLSDVAGVLLPSLLHTQQKAATAPAAAGAAGSAGATRGSGGDGSPSMGSVAVTSWAHSPHLSAMLSGSGHRHRDLASVEHVLHDIAGQLKEWLVQGVPLSSAAAAARQERAGEPMNERSISSADPLSFASGHSDTPITVPTPNISASSVPELNTTAAGQSSAARAKAPKQQQQQQQQHGRRDHTRAAAMRGLLVQVNSLAEYIAKMRAPSPEMADISGDDGTETSRSTPKR